MRVAPPLGSGGGEEGPSLVLEEGDLPPGAWVMGDRTRGILPPQQKPHLCTCESRSSLGLQEKE